MKTSGQELLFCDYNGSAPLDPKVKDFLLERLQSPLFANPNGLYAYGIEINQRIEQCRDILAELLTVDPHQVVFTSGSSESLTTYAAMISQLVYQQDGRRSLRVLSSNIEHAGVDLWLKQGPWFTGDPAQVEWVSTNEQGLVDASEMIDRMERAQRAGKKFDLVILMTANNETGVIQQIEPVVKYCDENEIALMTDTTQTLGRMHLDWKKLPLQFACGSAHKWGAPVGSGLMVLGAKQTGLNGLIRGHQEFGKRGGTQNYLGIEAMTIALTERFNELHLGHWDQVKTAKLEFEKKLLQLIPNSVVLGQQCERLPNTTLWGVPGLHGQSMQIELESQNIFVTTSAACSDNEPHTSHVLRSMGVDDRLGRSVIRMSVGAKMSCEDYERLHLAIGKAVGGLTRF